MTHICSALPNQSSAKRLLRNDRGLAVTTTLLLWVLAATAAAADRLEGKVVGIADGDTLTLLVGTTQHRIRLAEIDAPEAGQDWSSRSRQALAAKVLHEHVTIVITDTDRYGRLVGHVLLGERDINRELVREGHAWAYRKYLVDRSLLDDEAGARASGVGLWGLKEPVAPWEYRHNRATAAAGDCRIKGNISADGAKIYHVPGQRYYEATKIDSERGERMFCSEAEARGAGWRRSRI